MNELTPARRGSRTGFTLIELMITLVVLGILVALAAPSMSGSIRRARLDSALNGLTGDIAYARTLAIRSGPAQQVQLSGDAAGGIYTITIRNWQTGASRIAKRVNLAAEFPGLQITNGAFALSFTSRGILTPLQQQTLRIRQGEVLDSLLVLPTGMVYRAN